MSPVVRYVLLATSMLLGADVAGADRDGNFTVKGVGVLDCKAYLAAADAGDHELAQYAGYLTGYVSAYNQHVPDTFDLLPWQSVETLMLLMLRRCAQVPEANFGVAVTEMVRYFDDRKLAAPTERVRIGETRLEVYAPVLADLERALARRGYPTDDVAASLARFERDEGLPATGGIGQLTLLKLLYGREADAPEAPE